MLHITINFNIGKKSQHPIHICPFERIHIIGVAVSDLALVLVTHRTYILGGEVTS